MLCAEWWLAGNGAHSASAGYRYTCPPPRASAPLRRGKRLNSTRVPLRLSKKLHVAGTGGSSSRGCLQAALLRALSNNDSAIGWSRTPALNQYRVQLAGKSPMAGLFHLTPALKQDRMQIAGKSPATGLLLQTPALNQCRMQLAGNSPSTGLLLQTPALKRYRMQPVGKFSAAGLLLQTPALKRYRMQLAGKSPATGPLLLTHALKQ